MDIKKIQEEVLKIKEAPYSKKTDKQLFAYEILSETHKGRNKGVQPTALLKYNEAVNRKCKLTAQKVNEIRQKYNPHIYGKKRLAEEYGVSTSVIYRIIKGKSWREYDNST
jgi:DNA invertase Pin-like site-specific DNA recombinase